MKTVTIEIPDDCEIKIVKKEENEFKDGDVLLVECKTGEKYIFIYKSNSNNRTSCYCEVLLEGDYKLNYDSNYACFDQNILEIREADEFEKSIIKDLLIKDKKDDLLEKFFNIKLKLETVIKTYQDLIDNRVRIDGYFLENSEVVYDKDIRALEKNRDVAISKKVAKSMLAMAMISQLMPYYGGEVTDEEWNEDRNRYIITRYKNEVTTSVRVRIYYFLAFHTIEQRDEFLKNNKQLVKDYLMID